MGRAPGTADARVGARWTHHAPEEVRRRRRLDDRGAAVVEFALITPLLILLVFGILEFGSTFGQYLDVRHGAREAGRLASVNYNPANRTSQTAQAADLVAAACQRMELADDAEVTLTLVSSGTNARKAGQFAEVTVTAPVRQITGFFEPVLGDADLESQIEVRLEQDVTWAAPYTGSC